MPDYLKYDVNGRITKRWISVDPAVVENEENILQVTRAVIESVTKYHLVDGGVVRAMTTAEKDALLAEEAQAAADAETARRASLDTRISGTQVADMTLTKIDTAIDNIANLADAKVFLKRLARYLVKYAKNV